MDCSDAANEAYVLEFPRKYRSQGTVGLLAFIVIAVVGSSVGAYGFATKAPDPTTRIVGSIFVGLIGLVCAASFLELLLMMWMDRIVVTRNDIIIRRLFQVKQLLIGDIENIKSVRRLPRLIGLIPVTGRGDCQVLVARCYDGREVIFNPHLVECQTGESCKQVLMKMVPADKVCSLYGPA